ncbi:MAG: rod shape-determining protein MreD [Bacteroidota bacterium]
MIIEIIRIILRFLVLISIQVLVLNNIQLGGFINPFLYVMFILMLPVRMPKGVLLIVALITGLIIDMFSNTMGMHAAACLLMGYLRPGWLRIIAPRDGYETDAIPSVKRYGFQWFIVYASVLIFAHHLFLFYLEVFRFGEFFSTMLRVVLSTLVTLLLIMLSQYLFTRPEDRNK